MITFEEIKSWFNKTIYGVEDIDNNPCGLMSAEEAYYKSKNGYYVATEKRILNHQKHIKDLIKSKYKLPSTNSIQDTVFSSFYCVYDFENDMKPYIDEVFKPFVERGFEITNLSEAIPSLNDECVYLISWNKSVKSNTATSKSRVTKVNKQLLTD